MKKLICIVCPSGCSLTVNDDLSVDGARCPRGEAYGRAEVQNPVRVLTATVAVAGALYRRCPVKSAAPLPRALLLPAMEALSGVTLTVPVRAGQIVLENVCGSGVNVVAVRNLPPKN